MRFNFPSFMRCTNILAGMRMRAAITNVMNGRRNAANATDMT